jgi:hypothetical protein
VDFVGNRNNKRKLRRESMMIVFIGQINVYCQKVRLG